MQKKDREIKNQIQIENIIKKAKVCRLCFFDREYPYIVPLCFGYKDRILYFHSAPKGKKIDILKKNKRVGFEIDITGKIIKNGKHCDWDIEYQSVVGYGNAEFVENLKLKKEAINIILKNYTHTLSHLPEKKIKNTTIIKVDIVNMFGKKSL